MSSDNEDLTTESPSDDRRGDGGGDATEGGSGATRHLTHAQRVERVNAYLKEAASNGIWSAIE
jgi:hypothetical protein